MLVSITGCSSETKVVDEQANSDIKIINGDYASAIDRAEIGDTFIFGKYEQDDDSSNGNNSGEKCPNCNGTGYVKYYYGSSDLEAILDGYDPYTVGKCSMCDGTRK